MAYKERSDEEIIATWEHWLDRHPSPDEPVLAIMNKVYSPRQLVEAIKNREEWAVKVCLDFFREIAKKCDEDIVEIIDHSGKVDDWCD